MEAEATETDRTGSELDRIEAAFDAGDADLRGLGFWRIVRQVKVDRVLIDAHAAQIGRIDTRAFRRGVRFRLPVWLGNALLVAGVAAGAVAVWWSCVSDTPWLKGVALVLAGAVWTVAFHDPAHWVVGRAIGIRFTDYFLGGPPPPRPGLKTDYASYLRADPNSRAWFHASGAIATKVAPFLALSFWPLSGAPWWSAVALLIIGSGSIVTDVLFSTKTSDWMRFSRERAVARAMEPPPPA